MDVVREPTRIERIEFAVRELLALGVKPTGFAIKPQDWAEIEYEAVQRIDAHHILSSYNALPDRIEDRRHTLMTVPVTVTRGD
jgi:hypothetical protein